MKTATATRSRRRTLRRKELQKVSIKELRKLPPYVPGIMGDATSENPSKAEMIEAILDQELGKENDPHYLPLD